MKAISASIVILSGSILMATAGVVGGEARVVLSVLGGGLGLWGMAAWYWAIAVEKPQPPIKSDLSA